MYTVVKLIFLIVVVKLMIQQEHQEGWTNKKITRMIVTKGRMQETEFVGKLQDKFFWLERIWYK